MFRPFAAIWRLLSGTWNLWDKTTNRIAQILGSLTVLAAAIVAVIALLPARHDLVNDCLSEHISFKELEACTFDYVEFHDLPAFRERHVGSRFTFPINFGVAVPLGKDQLVDDKMILAAVGGWGPLVMNARPVVKCLRNYDGSKELNEYLDFLSNLRDGDEIEVTGILSEVSRSKIEFRDCIILRKLES